MYINLQLYIDPSHIKKVTLHDLSKTLKIKELQQKIQDEYEIPTSQQKLIHKGKIMSGNDGETLFHYNVNYNETIQVHKRAVLGAIENITTTDSNKAEEKNIITKKKEIVEDCESKFYAIGDLVDVKDCDESSETIGAYFEAKISRITKDTANTEDSKSDGLNYHIVYDNWPNDDSDYRFTNIRLRPRARNLIKLENLQISQKILVNCNQGDGSKVGEWYSAEVTEVNARRKKLVCTLFVGVDDVPLPDTEILQLDQIFLLEEPVPVASRDNNISKALSSSTIKRIHTIDCEACQDNDSKKCRECGCNKCAKKTNPESLIICDECQLNFHLKCIGLKELPEEDFYCAGCKREDTTIKPGDKLVNRKLKNAPSQVKEQKRDWGRGFACAGRSKTNDKVAMTFKGQIPGTEVGMSWLKRIQLSENGIHRPPVAGIHANEKAGAMSIVLNGGYEDDIDNGDEFLYTGSGGRDLDGNRRTNVQSFDQVLTKSNRGLAINCNVDINEEGAEAKDSDWRKGVAVRVVRGYKMKKHAKEYAPAEGFRYDGVYKVVKYFKVKGQSGFSVWRFVLRRDDPTPAPWTKEGTKTTKEKGYTCVYPDNYVPPASKEKGKNKRKAEDASDNSENQENEPKAKKPNKTTGIKYKVPDVIKSLIGKDKFNTKIWKQLLANNTFTSQNQFQECVTETFNCGICLSLVTEPTQLTCTHSMCADCWSRFINLKDVEKVCPVCRAELKNEKSDNPKLRAVLNAIFPGYEA